MDGNRIRKEKVAFSNGKGYVWTGPKLFYSTRDCREIERDNYHQINTINITKTKENNQTWRKTA